MDILSSDALLPQTTVPGSLQLVLKSIHCFKELCLSAVSKYRVSLLRVCGGKARMFPKNIWGFISYCAVQLEMVSADNAVKCSVMTLVISLYVCRHLNGKGGSPEANSEFDGLKCPWMCLCLPQTPKLTLWEQLERLSWENVLHYHL